MSNEYPNVITRFLRSDERLVLSEEHEMPLVIEAKGCNDVHFLQQLVSSHSKKILEDVSHYGAVLFRGFDISSEKDFEQTILSIQGLRGISDAFMSEEGRTHVDDLKYVLHTNSIYKTGGTVYLGGFHSENYYSADVPSYLSFCCFQPSIRGGETGLFNMQKVYQYLEPALKEKLEEQNYFALKWLVSEVQERYDLSYDKVIELCAYFGLPIVGEGEDAVVLMYKPNVFVDPISNKRSLQINLYELPTLNAKLRQCFMNDYTGKEWFWHRLVWKIPTPIFSCMEASFLFLGALFHSPYRAYRTYLNKIRSYRVAHKKNKLFPFMDTKVGSCFNEKEVEILAQLIRKHYCSCLWQKGDILLIDNKQVMHAGMPGAGPRKIRAMICNPLEMKYTPKEEGVITCKTRVGESIGYYMSNGDVRQISSETELPETQP